MPTLIVNADDFGRSAGINRGIAMAHERGIVTSTSIMVRWPAVAEVPACARAHPDLGWGLHCDLGEWVFRNGEWSAVYEVVSLDDAAAVEREVTRQLEMFRRLVGTWPTHLDSHQHAHRRDPARSILLDKANSLRIPLRLCRDDIQYCGKFYGQTDEGTPIPNGLSVDTLIRLLEGLAPGVTELSCHPGDGTDLENIYSAERAIELQTLCDPQVRRAIEASEIVLTSFAHLAGTRGS